MSRDGASALPREGPGRKTERRPRGSQTSASDESTTEAAAGQTGLPQAQRLSDEALRAAEAARNPAPPKPAVGTRISHPTRGTGSVIEHMKDGRVKIKYDNGDEHR